MEYTRGEWRVDEFKDRLEVVSPSEEVVICQLSVYNVSDKANAQLIASAPLQNETLEDVRSIATDDDLWETHTIAELRQIIAGKCFVALTKAEGGK